MKLSLTSFAQLGIVALLASYTIIRTHQVQAQQKETAPVNNCYKKHEAKDCKQVDSCNKLNSASGL